VRTADGVTIAYTWWRRPSPEIVVLAPGFWRVRRARENLYLATHFVRRGYDVVSIDFRGHGESGGAYTFGPSETHDFHASRDLGVKEAYRASRCWASCWRLIAAEAVARHPIPRAAPSP
jgi:alpha-beta hydrolase superfamily lysophospholipase